MHYLIFPLLIEILQKGLGAKVTINKAEGGVGAKEKEAILGWKLGVCVCILPGDKTPKLKL
jgi:hypothetical protein